MITGSCFSLVSRPQNHSTVMYLEKPSTDHTDFKDRTELNMRTDDIHWVTVQLCYTYYIGQRNYIELVYGYIKSLIWIWIHLAKSVNNPSYCRQSDLKKKITQKSHVIANIKCWDKSPHFFLSLWEFVSLFLRSDSCLLQSLD